MNHTFFTIKWTGLIVFSLNFLCGDYGFINYLHLSLVSFGFMLFLKKGYKIIILKSLFRVKDV